MIKGWFEKLPYPITGLMLGLATLGNVFGSYNSLIRVLCGSLAFVILVLIVVKVILFPKSVSKGLSMLPIASVMATFPMGLMVLTTYIRGMVPEIAKILWWIAFIINVAIIIFFTVKHLWPLKLQKFYASYFVTYIGIVVVSVTAKAFDEILLGKLAFIFGLLLYSLLLLIVTYRYIKKSSVDESLKPLIAIYAAPANLLVMGYLILNLTWSNRLVDILFGIGVITTVFVWYQMIKMYHLPFYPSYAAYTFPLVIGAFATKTYYGNLLGRNILFRPIEYFGFIQLFVACLVVIYVLIRYLMFMFCKEI